MPCCQAASTVSRASCSGMFRYMLPSGAVPKPILVGMEMLMVCSLPKGSGGADRRRVGGAQFGQRSLHAVKTQIRGSEESHRGAAGKIADVHHGGAIGFLPGNDIDTLGDLLPLAG